MTNSVSNPCAIVIPKKILRKLLLTLSLVVASVSPASAKPENVTDAEMRLLPQYCPDTQGFKYGYKESPRHRHWENLMGEGFWHMHHYCWALINFNRSMKAGTPADRRRSMWEDILKDYLYVIKNTPADFIMLPEVMTRAGEVEILLKRPNNANALFQRARELKPDYWPAYSRWAEFLIKHGKRKEALAIVESGLEHAPQAKVLLEQKKILGGKTPNAPDSSQSAPAAP